MGAREGVGGFVAVLLVAGGAYLKFQRIAARNERIDQRQAAAHAEHDQWRGQAMDMMNQASSANATREYLAWGVTTYHEEAREEAEANFSPTGATYRDILITKIFDRARTDGREDITKVLDKLRVQAKLADPDTWWMVTPQKKVK